MFNWLRKGSIVTLAFLLGLGTYSIVNGVPSRPVSNDQNLPAYVFAQNHGHYIAASHNQGQRQIQAAPANLPANTTGSSNWAGYMDTPAAGNAYTSVSASWTVPSISGGQRYAAAAQWIGLGGVSTTDLLQMGTLEDIENGQAVAKVFYEQLPSVAQEVVTVPAGSAFRRVLLSRRIQVGI